MTPWYKLFDWSGLAMLLLGLLLGLLNGYAIWGQR